MRMCAAKPEDYARKVCVSDLTDLFFKPMKGERQRLLRDVKRRFPEESIRHYGRSYFGALLDACARHPVSSSKTFINGIASGAPFPTRLSKVEICSWLTHGLF